MSCLYSCLIISLERVALAIIFDISSQHGCFREQVVLELLVDLVDFIKIAVLFAFAHMIPTFLCSVLTGRGDNYHLLSPACHPLYCLCGSWTQQIACYYQQTIFGTESWSTLEFQLWTFIHSSSVHVSCIV